MINFSINKKMDSHFIYQQIYKGIKANILEGRIKPDDKLPSKRILAKQLEVSVNSVMNAYDQLLAEGYIYPLERKGYYVENITQFIDQRESVKNTLPADLRETISGSEDERLSLSHMTSSLSLFPFKEWMRCQEKAIKNHSRELSEMPHPQGPYSVRKSICHLIALTRGVICEPEQIVIGAGTKTLVRQLMELHKKETIIAMEDPGYSRLYHLLKKMEFDIRPVNMDKKGININEVERSKANFAVVTPSHQFPTGKIMPISRRIELLNWSISSHDRYIIEDDYDSEFKYETDHIPSLQSLDRNQRVIYTGTFSKTMFPGLRISYMVLPPNLLREHREYYADLIQSSNTLSLFTMHYFIESGEYIRHVKRMNHQYEIKRKTLIKELQHRFKHKVSIENVPAGLHFLAHFKTQLDYGEIEKRAIKENLEIYTMRRFMLKHSIIEENRISLVLGFANIQEEKIKEAVNRLYLIFS
ncbi:PLP-dependent aminotransferase family protein [Metabacillus idriensis]|uniref:Aminotransferase class I/II-fold pyridoxal phosphate-dependent enzyme n=1 Tax=Metabacillus idriensis TaxID=324768 RepID=A0A6I2M316_9BACI|nr:PLP-dependent aminotransferase family protein [Metabacillus idriensis]MCM3595589.1 PLP-dependent aminotransferase family protein [Metabacillus idriensis]MRX52389.1 aminotransferase class I/II-fold pyridoxal phosphate-dependent enzyme [Metabacillus idriensis]OHR65032.1 GntR family transcriptional regulator [Bacillus sp. HMSC76G11]